MSKSPYQIENGIFFLHEPTPAEIARSEQLMRMEKRGNLTYDDAEVREFPNTFSYNLHKETWKRKAELLDQFLKYLKQRLPQSAEPYVALQVHCGMAWLSAKLAEREDFQVMGIDNRKWLLEQASRVFYRTQLKFLYGDLLEKPFEPNTFDLIVIDQAVTYFSDLGQLIDDCLHCLKPEGEIHLFDSAIYSPGRIETMQKQQKLLLRQLGCEAAEEYLFLHNSETLRSYNWSPMAKGTGLRGLLGMKKNDFSWIRIVK